MEAARRASLAEAEAYHIRASQIAAGASSSRTVETAGGTTDGAVVAEDTTEDSELGYSDFTLTLTFHLPHPQQKNMQLSPMHKKI